MKLAQLMIGVIFIITAGCKASAGTDVGNGGLTVACTVSKYPEVRLLEFVEAELLWSLSIDKKIDHDVTPSDEAFKIIIPRVLDRMSRVDPVRSKRLRKELNEFLSETKFIPNAILTPSEDGQTIALPTGCTLQQAVIQLTPELPNERRFNVSLLIWDLLRKSPIDQAGLVLHEMLYREAIERGQRTSKKTRYLNAFLFSNQFKSVSKFEYQSMLLKTGFSIMKDNP